MPIPVLVTPPAVEPITLAEAKTHLRVDGSYEDDRITSLIKSARRHVESVTGRALITQTWQVSWDHRFPSVIRLPKGRLQTVDAITYVDDQGVTRTLDESAYVVDAESEPGRITPAWGTSWPSTRCQPLAATVQWTCGYGDACGDVDQPLLDYLLDVIGTKFRYRELGETPPIPASILSYRLWEFG